MPKILLVEDNEMNRDMLSRRIVRGGYAVIIAEDGARGVAMATSDRPDLVQPRFKQPLCKMGSDEASRPGNQYRLV
jgi:CheY-like chemotaxis protein